MENKEKLTVTYYTKSDPDGVVVTLYDRSHMLMSSNRQPTVQAAIEEIMEICTKRAAELRRKWEDLDAILTTKWENGTK